MNATITINLMYETTETKTYRRDETDLTKVDNLITQLNIVTLVTLALIILILGLTCGQIIDGGLCRKRPQRRNRRGRGRRQRNRQPDRHIRGRSQHTAQLTSLQRQLQCQLNRIESGNFSNDFGTVNTYDTAN